jgi:hypothetical protein
LLDGSNLLSVTLIHPLELAPGIGAQKLVKGKSYGRHLSLDKAEVSMEWTWLNHPGPGYFLKVTYGEHTHLVPLHSVSSWLIGD